MEDRRFDAFTRTVSQVRSRRQALRSLVGAAAGALVLGGREVSAQECKGTGKTCKRDSQCCGTLLCVPPGSRTNSPKKNSATCQQPSDTCTQFNQPCPSECIPGSPCASCCVDAEGTTGGGFCYTDPFFCDGNPTPCC
jgi:hypothetical protein